MQLALTRNYRRFASDHGVFRPARVTVRPDRILRLQGYKNLDAVRPAIRQAAAAMAHRAEEIIAAEVHYRRLAIRSLDDGEMVLDNGVRFHNEAFHRHLADAREVVVAIATMGRALDDEVIAMMDKDRFEPLEALFLETCGWLGIEQTAKQFGDFLRTLVWQSGYRVSCRMAPGYSYRVDGRAIRWSLEDQKQIFEVFAGIELPVRLLESCAMLPKMSRSGIYGLAPFN